MAIKEEKILISRCLLGFPCRYDGASKPIVLPKWLEIALKEGVAIPFCPEQEGGLPTPRSPNEIEPSHVAQEVLNNQARVVDNLGVDNTSCFLNGAQSALSLCLKKNISFALLKSKSPSCGKNERYDGHFQQKLISDSGVTAQLLANHQIKIFDETELDKLAFAYNATQTNHGKP